ncbi:hypothetical protein PCASD_21820 [Puccinia coronata f. sp. avenae]|uniref:Uncharacterized protein n=1 Tax=Puccinia coronata f. sp. avenae TaxID=200324 RepID=A0A2N5S0E1_9BASI|nr:hypothetical protein PCASD_21820 [Puccinia coronata f. sp. avenae]
MCLGESQDARPMEFTGEPSGSHSGLTMKPILWDLNLPPPETFESNLAVNDHPEPLETRKRTWDDMTAESSSAHVEPAPQIRNNMIDVSKHPRSAISEDEVRACCEKQQRIWGRWNAKFSKTSLSTAQLSELSDKMKDVQKAVKNLFEIRILELRGEYLQPEVIKEDSPLKPSELVAGKPKGFLNPFHNLMIKLLIDLKELQIVSDKDLAFLLNTNENAKLILARNISNFSKSDLYVIFCYFDEIKKIPSINPQMAGLLNLLNEDTWKQIKFNFLKNQLMDFYKFFRCSEEQLQKIESIQEEIREEIKISRKPRFCRTWTWR